LIHWLGHERPPELADVGGKAANLDLLARAGLPVPAGFCLPAAAHLAYLEANGLAEQAGELAGRLPDEDARRELEGLALAAPLPERLAEVLAAATANLARRDGPGGRLAVRSSAVDEDGAECSFAGRHLTELGVPPDAVEGAVRRCWASLWSAAAIAYREANGLACESGTMPVLVQSLVPADASAVVFTVDPVAEDEDRIVVTATRGLGAPLVAGEVTPDTIVLDRWTMEPCAAVSGERAAGLSAAATVELAELALRAEELLGEPVDVEAAYDGRSWHLVQARAVTTIGRAAEVGAGGGGPDVPAPAPSFAGGAAYAESGEVRNARESARVA
jgi:phosphoenolpyruvate synthase/pyruvate phosphate dikinase